MLTLSDLLSTYDTYTQQRTSDVTEQLARSRQDIETKRLRVEQAQSELLQAQQHCLDQMRPHFEADARVLLKTPQFAEFIDFLVESVASESFAAQSVRSSSDPLLVAPSPTFWLLPSTSIALHLRNIEYLQLNNPDRTAVIQMQVAIQDWQQLVHVFPQVLRQQHLIRKIFDQIQFQFPLTDSQGENSYLNHVVIQELACVVMFVARLFSLNRITAIDEGFEL